jgi:hypothetical protein
MNDSNKSSNGLLAITSPKGLSKSELQDLVKTIQPLADQMDLLPVSLSDGIQVSAVIDYTPLLTRLCVAVERLVAQGEVPEGLGQNVAENAPQALNARPELNGRDGNGYQPVGGALNVRPPAGR